MTIIRSVSAAMLCVVFLIGCNPKTAADECAGGVKATVKDLAGLDGCKFVFELEDGARLQPQIPAEGTSGDPLSGFTFAEGKKVSITYEAVEGMSICMAGKLVKITCIVEQP